MAIGQFLSCGGMPSDSRTGQAIVVAVAAGVWYHEALLFVAGTWQGEAAGNGWGPRDISRELESLTLGLCLATTELPVADENPLGVIPPFPWGITGKWMASVRKVQLVTRVLVSNLVPLGRWYSW